MSRCKKHKRSGFGPCPKCGDERAEALSKQPKAGDTGWLRNAMQEYRNGAITFDEYARRVEITHPRLAKLVREGNPNACNA